MPVKRITTVDIRRKKAEGRPITVLTAYDYSIARLVDAAEVDMVLVGDSLGNVVLGYDSTISVTMADMLHHTRAVSRGVQRALVVADMPFLSYRLDRTESVRNAGRFLQEAGAQAVKLEGGREVAETVRAIVAAGIPVMGHLGLTPQSIHQLGGYRVQGKEEADARRLLEDAQALDEAGVFSIVLECIPTELARRITAAVRVPTIGIGAGPHCDGQVLVTHDLLGLFGEFKPKFVKRYAELHREISRALREFREDVEARRFPDAEHSYGGAEGKK